MLLTSDFSTVKLIDFESATWDVQEFLQNIRVFSTIEFCSPEYIRHKINGPHNDIWSLGHALYILHENAECFNYKTMINSRRTPPITFKHCKEPYKTIILKCLRYNYKTRSTIDELHTYLIENYKDNNVSSSSEIKK